MLKCRERQSGGLAHNSSKKLQFTCVNSANTASAKSLYLYYFYSFLFFVFRSRSDNTREVHTALLLIPLKRIQSSAGTSFESQPERLPPAPPGAEQVSKQREVVGHPGQRRYSSSNNCTAIAPKEGGLRVGR